MNSRAGIYHVRARTRGPRDVPLVPFVPQMVRYKFYQSPVFFLNHAHSRLGFMYLTINTRNRATSHARRRAKIPHAFRRDHAEAANLWNISVHFRAAHRNCIFGKRNFVGSLGHVETAVIVPLWQEFVAWRMIQNRKYLPRVKCTPDSR